MSGVARTYYPVAPLPDTNARQAAITQRPASTALLTIDSQDRYTDYVSARENPTSPYNFSIRKNESLMPGFMTRIGISEVCFPWTIPNINVKTQSIEVDYQIGSAPVDTAVLVLQEGFYTPHELAAQLTAEIATLVPGFTMTYGTYTNTIDGDTFETNQPVFQYATNNAANLIAFAPLDYNSEDYPFPPNTLQLFDLLGFGDENKLILSDGPVIGEFTYAVPIRYIDIVCNQLTNSQAQKDQTSQAIARDMLARIYVGGASGVTSTVSCSDTTFCPPGCAPTTIYRNFSTPKQIQWIPNQNIPGYLQFQIYDDQGNLLDESQGNQPGLYDALDWSMTMLVTEN